MILRADGQLLNSDSIHDELMSGAAELEGLRGVGVTFCFRGSTPRLPEGTCRDTVGITEAELGQLVTAYIANLSASEFVKFLADADAARTRYGALTRPAVVNDLEFVD